MSQIHKTLSIDSSPHQRAPIATNDIMRNVVWALLPVCGFAVYVFGISALFTILAATLTCLLTEHFLCRNSQQYSTIGDWSAVITGILYALTLPPGLPLWMVVMGGIIAISLGKYMFGGLGFNAFNPALVGRAFLQAAFPSAMTTWTPAMLPDRFFMLPPGFFAFPFQAPDYSSVADGMTSATPLALMKFQQESSAVSDLFLGYATGSLGETSALFILLGGVWLIARNMMNWRIPVSIFTTVFLISLLFHQLDAERYPDAMFALFSGGLMLGAVFMATDMVASPMTSKGVVIYGITIGVLVMIIRYWGGAPEGVMYAILLANALSPHIDDITRPKVFGSEQPAKKYDEQQMIDVKVIEAEGDAHHE